MNNIDVIISLTSHTQQRLELLPFYLFNSIIKYNYENVKIVLTLYKDDIQYIPPKLQELIDLELIELIVADKNLGPHLKYFYAMKKYRDLPVITIDDDSIYPKQMIPDFIKNSKKYPNTIICRSARIIDCSKTYNKWFECNTGVEKVKWNGCYDEVRMDLNPEGYGGIFYPANILDISDKMLPEIKDTFCTDDIYLTAIEQRKKIKCILCKYNYNKLDISTKGHAALSFVPNTIGINDAAIKKYLR